MNGLKITVIGMGLVFIVLFVLSLILELFKFLFHKETDLKVRKKNRIYQDIKTTVFKNNKIVDIAVISAVMATLLEDDERIVNIRRVK